MAEVQDEEQWLYGDDKDQQRNEKRDKEVEQSLPQSTKNEDSVLLQSKNPSPPPAELTNDESKENKTPEKEKEDDAEKLSEAEKSAEKPKEDEDEDDSSDDEPTVTIGKIVKQPDIMRPHPPAHRPVPASGLTEDDFKSPGKINGIPAVDYNLAELEEKPWRKPGADLSDYFNYGFTEETWIKYCDRQKSMRTNESGAGLGTLGYNALGNTNIPVSVMNDNSKYGMARKPLGIPSAPRLDGDSKGLNKTNAVNTIQVMTADRRTYSNKVINQSSYSDGSLEYGSTFHGDFFNTPPPNFYSAPPPSGPWGGGVPNVPPPNFDGGFNVPPPVPPPGANVDYYDDNRGFAGRASIVIKEEKDLDQREFSSRDRDRDRDRERESRHHRSRRSRSRSRTRHHKRHSRSKSRSRSRSKSRSPSHKHKRKKSKRDREDE